MKKWAKYLQMAFGMGLLTYAFSSGMFDWHKTIGLIANPWFVLLNLSFSFLVTTVLTRRWQILIGLTGSKIAFWKLFQIHMTSSFVSTFMPGAIGSDIAKAGLGIFHNPGEKNSILASIVLDRAFGLTVVVAIPGLACLGYFISGNPPLISRVFNTCLIVVFLLLLCGIPVFWSFVLPVLARSKITRVRFAARILRGHFKTALYALALGFVSMGSVVFQFYLQSIILKVDYPLVKTAVIVPIGLLASALSFLPLGIGVGQIAFYQLYKLVFGQGELGATVFTAIQSYSLIWNLLGAPFYFHFFRSKAKKHPTVHETAMESKASNR